MGAMIAQLKGRARNFLEAKITLMMTGEDEMNLEELSKLTTKEITDLYNTLADKQVKRFESRVKAEERTAQLLREAGKLDEPGATKEKVVREARPAKKGEEAAPPIPPARGGRAGKGKAAAGASEPPASAPAAEKAPPKTPRKAAKGPAAAKPGKGAASAPAAKEKRGRGAPVKNPTLTPIPEGSKEYNPKGFKPQPTSDRMSVLTELRKRKKASRNDLVAHFEKVGQDVNVDASIYFLVKFSFVKVVE